MNEIIKLIEYIMGHPFVRGALIAYMSFAIIVIGIVLAIFVCVFRSISNNRKRWMK